MLLFNLYANSGFNPWFIGRVGINSMAVRSQHHMDISFQSLVYWKGGDKLASPFVLHHQTACFNPWFIGRVGINGCTCWCRLS